MSGPMMGTFVDGSGAIREIPILVDQYGRPIVAPQAGQRNTDSLTADYQVVRQESNGTYINTTSPATIGGGAAGDTHLMGLRIWENFTGNLAIAGFADQAGAAQTKTLTTPTAGYYVFPDSLNAAGALIFTAANAADAMKAQVYWRPA